MYPDDDLPFVSVLVPVRNEEQHIESCLGSVLSQEYPPDRYEVLVLDGGSVDRTREIVRALAADAAVSVTLLDNPGRTAAAGMNLGLTHARGEIIVRVDGHAAVEGDFVRRGVEALRSSGADCVGGPIRSVGEGAVGEVIALAMSSPFGVGNARFRYSQERREVDTVAFGFYRRDVFDRIGLFEDIVGGEDDEFNYRLRDAGGRILLTPEIRSRYVVRSGLGGLWRQYLSYGRAKVQVLRRHPRQAQPRQFVPAAFVGALLAASVAGLVGRSWRPLAMVALPYAAASLAASASLGARHGWRRLPLLPAAFATLHISYGLGTLAGLAAECGRQCRRGCAGDGAEATNR